MPVSDGVKSTRHLSELFCASSFSSSSPLLQLTSPKVPFPSLVNVTVPEGLLLSAAVTTALQVVLWVTTTVEGSHESDVEVGIFAVVVTVTVLVDVTVVVVGEVTVEVVLTV